MTSVSNLPASTGAGDVTTHTVFFTLATTAKVSHADIVFPVGFDVSSVGLGTETGVNTGGTVTSFGNVVTWVGPGGGGIAAGTACSLELTNIGNSSTPGSYTLTVRTRSDASTVSDGPTTSSAFSIAAGTLADILFRTAAGGAGSELVSLSVTSAVTNTIYLAGYDSGGNYLSDQSCVFFSTNSNSLHIASSSPATSVDIYSWTAGNGLLVVSNGTVSNSLPVSVSAGTLSFLRLSVQEDAFSGYWFSATNISADDYLSLYAFGYDIATNSLGLQSGTWALSNSFGVVSGGSSGVSSITIDPRVATNGTASSANSNMVYVVSGGQTALVSNIGIYPGALASVSIESNTGGHAGIASSSLAAGSSLLLHAAGYDADGNYTGSVSTNWGLAGGIGSLAAVTESTNRFTAGASGTGSVVLTNNSGDVLDSLLVTVTNSGVVAHLVVRTAADGGGDALSGFTVGANGTTNFHVAGYDAGWNFVQNITARILTNGDGRLKIEGANPNLTPGVRGWTAGSTVLTVSNDGSGLFTNINVVVNSGTLSFVRIASSENASAGSWFSSTNVSADASVSLYVYGYDIATNSLGLQSGTWALSNSFGVVSGGMSGVSSITIDPRVATNGFTEAHKSNMVYVVSGGQTALVSNIGIYPGSLATVSIESNTGGHAGIASSTLASGTNILLYAAGYDADGNYTGSVSTNWGIAGGVGSLAAVTESTNRFTASTAGTGSVVLTNNSGDVLDSLSVTVTNSGVVAHLVVRTAADGGGDALSGFTVGANGTTNFHVAGYDAGWNFVQNITARILTNGDGRLKIEGANPNLTPGVRGWTAGSTVLTVSNDGSGLFTNINVVVNSGTLSFVRIASSENASAGSWFSSTNVSADASVSLYVYGYDIATNSLGLQSGTWALSNSFGVVSGGTSGVSSITIDPRVATNGFTEAHKSNMVYVVSGGQTALVSNIGIYPGSLASVSIESNTGGHAGIASSTLASGTNILLYAAGYDADGNYTGSVSTNWGLAGGIGSLAAVTESTNRFTASTAGTGSVVLTNNSGDVLDSLSVTVTNSGVVAHLVVRTAADGGGDALSGFTVGANGTTNFHVAGYDAGWNFVQNITARILTNGDGRLKIEGANPNLTPGVRGWTAGSTVLTVSNDGSGLFTNINVVVNSGTLSFVRIASSENASAGSWFSSTNVSADASVSLYVYGYDIATNSLGLQSGTWALSNGFGVVSGGTSGVSSITIDPRVATNGFTEAHKSNMVYVVSGGQTALVSNIGIYPGSLATVSIESNTGGHAGIASSTLASGTNILLYAAGYDADGNYTGSVSTNWGIAGGVGSLAAVTESTNRFTASTAGTGSVVLTNNSGDVLDSLSVTVTNSGVVAHLVVRTAADGGGDALSGFTVGANGTTNFHVAGYDAGWNFVQNITARILTNGDGRLKIEGANPNLTPGVRGWTAGSTVLTVSNDGSGLFTNINVVVNSGTLSFVRIASSENASAGSWFSSTNVSADASVSLYVYGYDIATNSLGLQSGTWALSNSFGVVSGGTSGVSSITIDPRVATNGFTEAHKSNMVYVVSGGQTALVSNIGIYPGSLASVSIESNTGGHAGIASSTLASGTNILLYAAGYDADGNYTGSVSTNWGLAGGIGSLAAVTESTNRFTASTAGTGSVVLTNNSGDVLDSLSVTVTNSGVVAHLVVRTAADGGGDALSGFTVGANGTTNFHVAGYDAGWNFVQNITARILTNGDGRLKIEGANPNLTPGVRGWTAGSTVLTVSNDGSGLFTNINVVVNSGTLSFVRIASSENASAGSWFSSTNVSADASVSLYVYGYDIATNSLGLQSGTWALSNGFGVVSGGTSGVSSITIDPRVATNGFTEAHKSNMVYVVSGGQTALVSNIGIYPGSLASVSIESNTGGHAGIASSTLASGTNILLYAAGYDADGNYTGSVSTNWGLAGGIGSLAAVTESTNRFTASTAGTGSVVLTNNSGDVLDSLSVTVTNSGVVAHLVVRTAADGGGDALSGFTVGANGTTNFHVAGYDAGWNFVQNITARILTNGDGRLKIEGANPNLTPGVRGWTAGSTVLTVSNDGSGLFTNINVVVNSGTLSFVRIASSENASAGSWFSSTNVSADASVSLYVYGYDIATNSLGLQSGTWALSNSFGVVSGGTSGVSSITIDPRVATNGFTEAHKSNMVYVVSGGQTALVSNIGIYPGSLATVSIESNTGGHAGIASSTLASGTNILLYAAGYDADGNYTGSVSTNWGLAGGIGSLAAVTESTNRFTASTAGTGSVVLTNNSGDVLDSLSVTVTNSGVVAHLVVRTAADGGGDALSGFTVGANGTTNFHVAGYDAGWNFVQNITARILTNGDGRLKIEGANPNLTPGVRGWTAGSTVLTVSNDGSGLFTNINVVVNSGTLSFVRIASSENASAGSWFSSTNVSADASVSLYVYGYDIATNSLGLQSGTWALSNSFGVVSGGTSGVSSITIDPRVATNGFTEAHKSNMVYVVSGGQTALVSNIGIYPGSLATVSIESNTGGHAGIASSTLASGTNILLYAAGYDADGNYTGSVSTNWGLAGGIGSLAAVTESTNRFTASTAGTGSVVLTNNSGDVLDSLSVTVTNSGVVAHLVVRTAADGGGDALSGFTVGANGTTNFHVAGYDAGWNFVQNITARILTNGDGRLKIEGANPNLTPGVRGWTAGSTVLTVSNDGSGLFTNINVVVNSGTLSFVRIASSENASAGSWFSSTNVSADASVSLYVYGYDIATNSLGLQSGTWALSNSFGVVSGGTSGVSSITIDPRVATNGFTEAHKSNMVYVVSGGQTALVSNIGIYPGSLATVSIESNTGGNAGIASSTLASGTNILLYAAGYDADGNYTGSVSTNWGLAGGIGSLAAVTESTNRFTASTAGTGSVVLTNNSGDVLDSLSVTVTNSGVVAHLVVRTAADGGGDALSGFTVGANGTTNFHVAGYDAGWNFVQNITARILTNGDGRLKIEGANPNLTPGVRGWTAGSTVLTVSNDGSGLFTNINVVVNSGTLSFVRIASSENASAGSWFSSTNVSADASVSLYVYGYDIATNSLGLQSGTWALSNGFGVVSGGTSGVSSITIDPRVATNGFTEAHKSNMVYVVSGGQTALVSNIGIYPGSLASVSIESNTGGHAGIASSTLASGTNILLYAAGYDADGNYTGSVSTNWGLAGGIGSLAAVTESTNRFTASTAGTGSVVLTNNSGDVLDSLSVTVTNSGVVAHLVVRTAADGGGDALSGFTVGANGTTNFHVAGYDAGWNFVQNITARILTNGDGRLKIEGANPNLTPGVRGWTAGSTVLTVSNDGSGLFTNINVVVNSGTLSFVRIASSENASAGSWFSSTNVSADASVSLYVYGYDIATNSLGLQSGTWALSNSFGVVSGGTSGVSSITIDPRVATNGFTEAHKSNMVYVVSGGQTALVSNIGIYPGSLATVSIESNTGGNAGIASSTLASGTNILLYAAGYDADGNYTGSVSTNWGLAGGIGSLAAVTESTNRFTASTAGTGSVVLTNNSGDVLDSLSVTVTNSGVVAHLVVRTAADGGGDALSGFTVGANGTTNFHVAGYDAGWNFVQNITARILTNGDGRLKIEGANPNLTPGVRGWTAGSTVLTVSNDGSGLFTNINVVVNSGTLSFVRIASSENASAGSWFSSTNVSADASVSLYVYGYDIATNSLGLQSGTWALSNGFGVVSGGTSGVSSITIDPRVATNGFTEAHKSNMVYVVSGGQTALVSNIGIYPGSLASVSIESNTGGHAGIASSTLASGTNILLYAAGYDADGNYTGSVSTNWGLAGGIGSLAAVTESTNRFTASTAGTGSVVLTNNSGDVLDSLSVTVTNSGVVAHLVVRTAADGGGDALSGFTVGANGTTNFHVAGYDAGWNFVQNITARILTNGDGRLKIEGANPNLTPGVRGWTAGSTVLTVSNDGSGLFTNINVVVNSGTLSFVRIASSENASAGSWFSSTNVSADASVSLYVYGYDIATNSLGLQSGTWALSNGFGVVSGGTSGVSSITIDPRVATNGFTEAHKSNMVYVVSGGQTALVSNIGIYPGSLASVSIESNTGGHAGIASSTLASGTNILLYAAGYDADGNYTGSVSTNWGLAGGIGSLAAVTESTNRFTASTAGTGSVVLTNNSGDVLDSLSVTVTNSGVVAHLVVRTAADGGGDALSGFTVGANGTTNFHVAGYDAGWNFVQNITARILTNGDGRLKIEGANPNLTPGVRGWTAGSTVLTVSNDGSGLFTNINVVVNSGTLSFVRIASSENASAGSWFSSTNVSADASVSLYVYGYDIATNSLGLQSGTWALSNSFGVVSGGTSGVSSITIDPRVATNGFTEAHKSNMVYVVSGGQTALVSNIGIYPGSLATVSIESNTGGHAGIASSTLASGTNILLYAAGYDADGNYTGSVSTNWGLAGGIGSLAAVTESTNRFTASTAGTGSVVLTNNSGDVLDSLSVTVTNSGVVAHLVVRTAADGGGDALSGFTVGANGTTNFHVAGYDAGWNFVQNITARILTNGDGRLKIEGANPNLTPGVRGWTAGSTVLTVSNDGSGLFTNINVVVNSGTLSFVRIASSENASSGSWFSSTNVSADASVSLYVYGYDIATNSLGLQSGTWALSNGFGVVSGGTSGVSSITIDPRVATNGFTEAHKSNMVYVVSGGQTALVSNIGIYPGSLASVSIESNTGGHAGIASSTLASGTNILLYAAGYDADGNYTGSVSTNWGLAGGIGSLAAVTESTNRFTASTAGTGSVVLTNNSGDVLDSLSVTVTNSGVVAHLVVRTAADGGGDALSGFTVGANGTTNFHVAGYDAGWNFVQNITARILTNGDGRLKIEGANPNLTPGVRGWTAGSTVLTVSNDGSGLFTNINVVVNSGTLSFVRIASSENASAGSWFSSTNVSADASVSLYVYGYDIATNSLGLQSGTWALSNSFGVVSGGTSGVSSITIDPRVATNGFTEAHKSNMVYVVSGGQTALVSNIGIYPGSLATVSIESNTGGHAGIASSTLASGTNILLYAAGYDADGNYTGSVSTNWGLAGGIGSLAAVTESTNRFTASIAGTGSVVLTNNSGDVLDSLSVTVTNSGVVAHLVVRTAADGGGDALSGFTVGANGTTNFHVAGYDAGWNFVQNITARILTNGDGRLKIEGANPNLTPGVRGWTAGSTVLTVSNDGSGLFTNINVVVNSGTLSFVRIASSENASSGSWFSSTNVSADASVSLYVYGYDIATNSLGLQSGTWALSNSFGVVSGGTSGVSSITIDPRVATNGFTEAHKSNMVYVVSGGQTALVSNIGIYPGSLASVSIESNTGGHAGIASSTLASGTNILLYAAGYDADGNYTGSVSTNWGIAGGIGSLTAVTESTNRFTASTAGTGSVVLTNNSGDVLDSLSVTVTNSGVVAHLVVRTAADGGGDALSGFTVGANGTTNFHVAGYDAGWNFVQNITARILTNGDGRLKIEGANPNLTPGVRGWTAGSTVLTVSNDGSGLFTNINVVVNSGTLSFVRIASSENASAGSWFSSTNVSADASVSLYVYGYDIATNSLGLQSGTWALSNSFGVVSGGTSGVSSITIDPRVATNGFTEAHKSNMVYVVSGGQTALVSNIGIYPGSLASVSIESNTGGHAGIASSTLASGTNILLYAAGYDADGNYTGSVSTNWGLAGGIGSLAAVTESTNRFTASTAGTGSVVLTNNSGDVLDSLSVTVTNSGVVAHLVVRTAADGGGDALSGFTVGANGTTNFHVAGYDAGWNFVQNITARILTNGDGRLKIEGANPNLTPGVRGWTAGSTVLTVSNDGSGLFTNINVVVNSGTLSFVRIASSENASSGSWFSSTNVSADASVSLYVYGYDIATNSLGLQSGTWALSNSFGVVSGGTSGVSSITIDPRVATNGFTEAHKSNMVYVVSGGQTALVSNIGIYPGSLASVSIESNTGGHAGIASSTLASGTNILLYAAGYDADGNYTGSVSTNWGIAGGIGSLAAVTESTNRFTASTAGTGSVVLTNNSGDVLDSLSVTVTSSGIISRLAFRLGPGAGAASVDELYLSTPGVTNVYVAGYDASGNFVSNVMVYGGSTNTSVLREQTNSLVSNVGIRGWKSGIGSLYVTNTVTGLSTNIRVTVSAGTQAYVAISGSESSLTNAWFANTNISADGSVDLFVYSYDVAGNSRGLVSGVWRLSNSFGVITGASNSVSSITIDPRVATNGFTDAHKSNMVHVSCGLHTAIISNIGIYPGSLATVSIESNTGGHAGIASSTLASGTNILLYAAGYDADGNYTGGVSTNWGIAGGVGSLAAVTESTNRFTASTAGTGSVVLTNNSGDVLDSLSVTVTSSGIISRLAFRLGPGAGAASVDELYLTTPGVTNVYVAGYDASGNFVSNVMVYGGSTNTSVLREQTNSLVSNVGVRGWKSGIGSLYVTNTVTGLSTNIRVTVSAGTQAYVAVSASESSLTNAWFANTNISADGSVDLFVYSYDVAGNSRGLVSGVWRLSNSFGVITGASNSVSSITIDPRVATNGFTDAHKSNMVHVSCGLHTAIISNIGIYPGALASVSIESNTGGHAGIASSTLASGTNILLYAAGYDADGNYTGGVSTNWGLAGGIGSLAAVTESTNRFTASTAGTGSVVLTNNSGDVLDSLSVTVTNSGTISRLAFRLGPGAGAASVDEFYLTTPGVTNVYVAGYDASGNFVSNVMVYGGSTNTSVLREQTNSLVSNVGIRGWKSGIGSLYVTNTVTGLSTNIRVTVSAGTQAYVAISGSESSLTNAWFANTNISADGSVDLFVYSYDVAGNSRGLVSGVWRLSNSFGVITGASNSVSSITIDPRVATNGFTDAHKSNMVHVSCGLHTAIISNIGIYPGSLATVSIESNTGGHAGIASSTLASGTNILLYAAGYDADGNYTGSVSTNWGLAGGIGSLAAVTESTNRFTASTAGTGSVVLTNNSGDVLDSLSVTVTNSGVLAFIRLRTGANNAGIQVDSLTVTAGQSTNFYAAGYDAAGNYIEDVNVYSGSTNESVLRMLTNTAVSNPAFMGWKAGIGAFYVTNGSIVTNITVTIVPGAFNYVRIGTNASDDPASIVNFIQRTTDGTAALYALGFDLAGNYLGTVPGTWSLSNNFGRIEGDSAGVGGIIVDPTNVVANGLVAVVYNGTNDILDVFQVDAGVAAKIVILTNTITRIPAGPKEFEPADTETLYSAAYDADNNYLGLTNVSWILSGGIGSLSASTGSSTVFTAGSAGSGTIVASNAVGYYSVAYTVKSPGISVLSLTTTLPVPGRIAYDQEAVVYVSVTNHTASPYSYTTGQTTLVFRTNAASDAVISVGNVQPDAGNVTTIPGNSVAQLVYRFSLSSSYAYSTAIVSLKIGGQLAGKSISQDSYDLPNDISQSLTVSSGASWQLSFSTPEYVLPGSSFNVTLVVSNTGEAPITNVQPADFTLSTGTAFTLTGSPTGSVTIAPNSFAVFTWTYTVNAGSSGLSVQYTGKATGVDEIQAVLMPEITYNAITTVIDTLSAALVVDPVQNPALTTVEGAEKLLYTLNVSNSSHSSIPAFQLSNINFLITDKDGQPVAANSVLSGLQLRTNGIVVASAASVGTASTVGVTIPSFDLVSGGVASIDVYGVIAQPATGSGFRVSISGSSNFNAYISGAAPVAVKVVDTGGREISDVTSSLIVIKKQGFTESLSSYPNPFSPSEGPVKIDFYLDTDSRVTVKLYTVTGSHVRTLSDKQLYPAGLNTLLWSALNGNGKKVRNGVYLCVIKNEDTGKQGVLKIAVVR